MVRIILLIFALVASDWSETPTQDTHYKLFYSAELKTSKWVGHPDPNYSWDGDRLSYERTVKDEEGKDVLVKTYRDPIEIIADFKPETKIFGIEGNIERNAVKKFGGSLKGFIWLDKVTGGGEVILPFTAPHIFIAKGDRLNPVLSEISTDTSADNYYEIVEGRTHVYIKSFSGIGGAAGNPATLIAHYKFNEDGEIPNDNAELVTNGDFSAWSGDNPTGWIVNGESAPNREISEVGAGESHGGAGTGMCNLYTDDGTSISVARTVTGLVIGRKYQFSININKVTNGSIKVYDWPVELIPITAYSTTGIKTLNFVATATSMAINISRYLAELTDVTFDDVSIKLLAVEDSSGNDHDALAQQDTDAISVTGKINTAFDFNGSSDYIIIPDHDDFTPALAPSSISIWIKPDDATSYPMASKGVYNTDGEWQLSLDSSDKLFVRRYDESVANCYIGRKYNTALTSYENTWVHIVWTSDGGTASSGDKLYINGVQVDDTDDENNAGSFVVIENLTGVVKIGTDGTSFANGTADNVMFFSTELDIFEVQALYNHGAGTENLEDLRDERLAVSRRRR